MAYKAQRKIIQHIKLISGGDSEKPSNITKKHHGISASINGEKAIGGRQASALKGWRKASLKKKNGGVRK